MTGREIIDVLERFLVLAWFRYGALKDPNQSKYPPIVIWRFDTDSMEAETIKKAESSIFKVVKSFHGNVSWILYFSGKNWVLLPERMKFLEDSGAYRGDTEILVMLGETDPNFGMDANKDLPVLAKIIEKNLSELLGTKADSHHKKKTKE